jgi:hypothetical protein
MAAFRIALDFTLQQVVEVALDHTRNSQYPGSCSGLDRRLIPTAKRNVALDRVAFEERL